MLSFRLSWDEAKILTICHLSFIWKLGKIKDKPQIYLVPKRCVVVFLSLDFEIFFILTQVPEEKKLLGYIV